MRVVLTGASGQLGAYLISSLLARGHEIVAWSSSDPGERSGVPLVPVDLADPESIADALDRADPEVILHVGAISTADGVRRNPDRARLVNVEATARLADWCGRRDRRIVFTSTDLVFDGSRPWNREDDPAEPVLAYGRSKRDAEPSVLATPRGLVARLPLLFGPSRCGREGYFDRTLAALQAGATQTFFVDEFRTPLHFALAADDLARLVESDQVGLLHVAGAERISRFDLMRRVAAASGLDPGLVLGNRQAEATFPEPRPADVSLDSSRLAALWPGLPRPSIEESLALADRSGEALQSPTPP